LTRKRFDVRVGAVDAVSQSVIAIFVNGNLNFSEVLHRPAPKSLTNNSAPQTIGDATALPTKNITK